MSFEEKVTYYDPSETEEFVVLPKGTYKARVSNFEFKKTWTNKDNQIADIYEASYKLDESISSTKIKDDKGNEYPGSKFVSRDVKSKGFFLWKAPGKDEDFMSNPAGNKRISIFLESANYPLVKKEIENSSGSKVTVVEIPEVIDESKIIGKPVIIEVTHEEYNDKLYAKEMKVMPWKDAPAAKVEEEDDLPF